ncbi:MAG TPA: sigma 54-interacting transcriptional regulator [Polyangiaceae bacterium]|nr:sigma 54-interacting transcriptional regulator [Polyangiaceae bacterium]
MRVFVSSPEASSESLEIRPGSAVLLGRTPDPERLPRDATQPAAAAHEWHDSRVSANHALVSYDGHSVVIRDLHSRNGTWVKLSPGSSVRLDGSDAVVLQLAGVSAQGDDDVELPRADWSEESEFAETVRTAVTRHLERTGMRAQAVLHPGGPPAAAPNRIAFALEDGCSLIVEHPLELTTDPRWSLLVGRLRSWVALENARLRAQRHAGEGLILSSPAIRAAHDHVQDAAQKGMRVVLLGPTGAGKDRLARCYHEHSPGARGPFHAVNCAQLSKDLIYAQLFGAKRGSFTGSTQDLVGAVQAASDGTLFLDEVSEMPAEVQGAVLRFLDRRGEYHRLGEEQRARTARNVQIVCATSADITDKLARGELREDLWYRIAERTVVVKPLSERPEDVLAFLKSSVPGERREESLERGGTSLAVSAYDALTPAALELVTRSGWRGNFRSLESFVVRLPTRADHHSIGVDVCRAALAEAAGGVAPVKAQLGAARSELSGERWHTVLSMAQRAYEADEGTPSTWGSLVSFLERYLKPAFVAHACGLERARGLERNTNLSELARQLDLKDGTTVKTHLQRYFARFAREPE